MSEAKSELDHAVKNAPVPAHIRALPLYVPGRSEQSVAREYGLARIIKLASNENPLGCSPHVAQALAEQFSGANTALARYPDSDAFDLRNALAHYHGVPANHIAVTNGSHELIDLCAALSLRAGTAGLYSQYAFQAYPISIKARGATAIEVPASDYRHDPAAMREALTHATRLVYICNPNNPTGTLLAPAEIEVILDSVGPDTLVVLDEAYIDYVDPTLRPDSISLLARYPQLVVARTFSKAYGLASLRVGYGIMHPDLVDAIARIRPTFSVNALAQRAALAALADRAFLQRTQSLNRAGIAQITQALERQGIPFIPTHANFITIGLNDAKTVAQRLLQAGIVVRPLGAYELDNLIRVTVGTEEENDMFLRALFAALERD
ncbi:histidinol-phosphate transaminase [Paraburkholderia nemoris]|uniref:Histidinol-phosphate aminotransferase n=1 Tax=Paraburkholderia nemoris TaxID=2793076 RepID=A0ABM8QII7_9BURK|nr:MULTISPECIES: histidinol-phosphate transaminase [Paraburkholderia]MBK3815850.1 histidinol-phosphate transaminase [Paraburkholderia aspalathi]CAE6698992.1 Histidinol-phosphate aminotransferase [Paraburkholderia nemoris]CAE6790595.1 Histidinol-phosphate aminotransferase [Paraburkholderia nemoris]